MWIAMICLFQLPATVWLAGFFNPQSFLTAIMQSTARKNEWPLDKMCLHCEVSKKHKDEFTWVDSSTGENGKIFVSKTTDMMQ
jgi:hypothetical protein